jgi:hypothetical protein
MAAGGEGYENPHHMMMSEVVAASRLSDPTERRQIMVLRYTKKGTPYREPPYTQEELDDLYRRMGNIVAMTRPDPPAKPAAKQASARQRQQATKRGPSPKPQR